MFTLSKILFVGGFDSIGGLSANQFKKLTPRRKYDPHTLMRIGYLPKGITVGFSMV